MTDGQHPMQDVRDANTETPGRGHLIEAGLTERANLDAYGMDTSAVDKKLAGLGQPTREQAAAERRKAATGGDGDGDGDGNGDGDAGKGGKAGKPGAGRQAPPRTTS